MSVALNKRIQSMFPHSIWDVVFWPVVIATAGLYETMRRWGLQRLPRCRAALIKRGVFPIRNHYYEPLFDCTQLDHAKLDARRSLPGVDLNTAEQLALLSEFRWQDEIRGLPDADPGGVGYHFDNPWFGRGDGELWYQLLRLKKPRMIIEIGSGYSTRAAVAALTKNRQEDPAYQCRHVCVEPYEMPWLESLGVEVIRKRVEHVDTALFANLCAGDILFIDSSHMIRPQGDVLVEFLEILPSLPSGVIVHIHDIFTPYEYPRWLVLEQQLFWNEQYLLEALLSGSNRWKIILAANQLRVEQFDKFKQACPKLLPETRSASIYIERL